MGVYPSSHAVQIVEELHFVHGATQVKQLLFKL